MLGAHEGGSRLTVEREKGVWGKGLGFLIAACLQLARLLLKPRSSPTGAPAISVDPAHMSHSLNSLKGDYIGDYIGDYYRGY